jgi:hypothetical protein
MIIVLYVLVCFKIAILIQRGALGGRRGEWRRFGGLNLGAAVGGARVEASTYCVSRLCPYWKYSSHRIESEESNAEQGPGRTSGCRSGLVLRRVDLGLQDLINSLKDMYVGQELPSRGPDRQNMLDSKQPIKSSLSLNLLELICVLLVCRSSFRPVPD